MSTTTTISPAPVTDDDWKHAEALVTDYVKTTQQVTEPLQFRRFDATPLLLAAWWSNGQVRVLVYDGKIQEPRGIQDLPAYLTFLGEARIRALDTNFLSNLLMTFKASRPSDQTAGIPWSASPAYKELYPAITQTDGVVKYVVHYVQKDVPLPPGIHSGPPAPGGPANPQGPMTLQRWSLQLFPVVSDLAWKLEDRVERPRP